MREFADAGLWRPSILICTMLFTMVAMLRLPKRFGPPLRSRADEPWSMNPPNRGPAANRLGRTNLAAPYVIWTDCLELDGQTDSPSGHGIARRSGGLEPAIHPRISNIFVNYVTGSHGHFGRSIQIECSGWVSFGSFGWYSLAIWVMPSLYVTA